MANLSSSNVFGNLTVTGDISGDGFNIFNLNAANISGIVASANLPSNNAYFLTPSDFWSPTQYFSPNTSTGWIGSVGSFRIGMGWNGYRNNSDSYTYSGVDGNTTTAGLLEHGPDGLFYRFGSTAGTSLPSIFSVNTSGTVSASTFNATSTTNGGFQGIDSDSVTSPSFTWSGDLNTGIYRPAADQLGITTGGASRLIVQTTLSTFSNEVASTSANSFRIVSGNYGVFWRNTGTEYYLLQTASGDQYGTFNSARPLTVNLATGIANINGNSATSTKWASGINLTIGSTAKSVDGSTNVAWSLAEIGAAAASHTHPYDNYVSWALRTDGTQRANITSGGIVNFVGGTNVTLAYSSTNNTITINSTDTNTTYTAGTGISIASNVITNTAPNVTTNLSYTSAAAQGTVVSSDGTNAVIPAATTSIAGLLTATDKTKLDGIATGAQVNQNAFSTVAVSGQSSVVADAVEDTLTLVAGSNVTITTNATTDTITISATDTNTTYSAGTGITLTGTTFSLTGESYTSAEKTKLAGIETGAQVNVGTNLGVTNGTTAGPTITSSTGTNVVFPTASATISGAVTTGAQTFAGTKTFSSTITGSITGNAGTASVLQTARTINGTSFNGSANITTANWGTARIFNVGGASATVNGDGDVTFPAENISSGAVMVSDNRSVNDQPQNKRAKAVTFDFKFSTSVGSPPVTAGDSYSHIMTFAGWSSNEGSGGWPTQLSIGNGIAFRRATSATTWGGWKQFLHGSNFNSYALPLTGGTLTGNLGIRNNNPTLTLQDSDGNSGFVHVNSNTFYILRGAVDSTSWTQVGNGWPLEISLTNNHAKFGGQISTNGTVARGDLCASTNVSTATDCSIHLGYAPANFYGFRIVNQSNATALAAGSLRIQRGTTQSWSDCLSVDNDGNLTLHFGTLRLRDEADNYNIVRWNSTVDGPEVIGYKGGRLGSSWTGNIALRWAENGYCYFGSWTQYPTGTGLFWTDNTHLYSAGSGKMVLRGNEAESWLRMETHGGVIRGHIYADAGGIGFLNSSGAWSLRVDNSGNGIFTGNVTAYFSDDRLKTKISKIDNAINKVKTLEGFIYTENDVAESFGYTNKKRQAGVSAQSVQKVLPEAVTLAPFDSVSDKEGNTISKSGENYLTVDYSKLVPLLIEAIKEQQQQIDELKNLLGGQNATT